MTSKSLFFKLMKENEKQRLWSIALISLVFFFAFPVYTALNISSRLSEEFLGTSAASQAELELARERLTADFLHFCSMKNGFLIVILIIFAVLCAVSGFSYLHSRKKTDFYHSIPVKREVMFAVVCLNGIINVAVPFLVSMSIAALMIQLKGSGDFSWGQVLCSYGFHMAFYCLIYAVSIAAVILTGNTLVGLLGISVFFLWGPAVVLLKKAYFAEYFVTFLADGNPERWVERSSPVAWYITSASSEHPASRALWALIFAVIILEMALLLYRRRPSESAGRAMAFPVSQPIIKILLVIPISLLGSLVFHSMMRSDGWSVFGLFCGLVISSCVIEIIYSFDFKRLFAHGWQMAGCGLFALAILAFFRFDLSGYDSYLPGEDRLDSVGIYCSNLDQNALDVYGAEPSVYRDYMGNYRYVNWKYRNGRDVADEMRIFDMKPVLAVAKQGVSDTAGQRSRSFYHRFDEENGEDIYGYTILAYHLKSGKTVYRQYYMNLSAVAENLDKAYDLPEYKKAVYPVLSYEAGDIAGVNYQEQSDYRHVDLRDEAQKKALLEAYQKELGELTSATRRTESPIAALQFKTKEHQELIDMLRKENGDFDSFNHYLYFPIHPSFDETIGILEECGIEAGSLLTSENTHKIVLEYRQNYVSDDMETEDMYPESVVVTDKAQIEEILNASVSYELNQSNLLNPQYDGVRITAYVPVTEEEDENNQEMTVASEMAEEEQYGGRELNADGEYVEYETYSLSFDFDRVPGFVKEMFGLTEDGMKADEARAY